MALINKLNAIGAAIREKPGKTDLLTLEQMPVEIAAIETGGGGDGGLPEEAFKFTGDCTYKFAYTGWTWFLDAYENKITTNKITNTNNMFAQNTTVKGVSFDFNFDNSTHRDMRNMFQNCTKIKKIGKMVNAYPDNLLFFLSGCSLLRELPEFENLNLSRIQTYAYSGISRMFGGCYSLRRIPEDFLKQFYGIMTTSTNTIFYNGFQRCYTLDEIRGLNPKTGNLTSNAFDSAFDGCSRVKDIIFATQEDGTPYTVNWKNQTIELDVDNWGSSGNYTVGVAEQDSIILNYNSGITIDKKVTDDATYQALKNDPDWYTLDIAYSRYNHDSAVNTINSLPITTNTGCTIRFKGNAGSATDGGAINTLTEAEIAVAAAKGWTVALT